MKNDPQRLQTLLSDLNDIGCPVMSRTLADLYRSPEFLTLDPLGLLEKVVRPQYEETISSRISARLKRARLDGCTAAIDTCCDSNERIYLPNGAADILRQVSFVEDGQNLCIVGASGSGKTYFAKALSVRACSRWRVLYTHCDELLGQLSELKEESTRQYNKRLSSLANLDLLTLDDFLLQPLGSTVRASVLYDLLEKRCDNRHSTIVCSQRSPESWSAMLGGDTALSDAVARRATMHYSVVIETPVID